MHASETTSSQSWSPIRGAHKILQDYLGGHRNSQGGVTSLRDNLKGFIGHREENNNKIEKEAYPDIRELA